MFVLDPEHQTLIKMRYILRLGGVTDDIDLDNKVRDLELDSKTIKDIADDITDCIQDSVSRTSVGRWFGIYTSNSNINRSNRTAIAKYLLCDDWSELVKYNPEDIEDRIYKEHNLAIAEQLVSMDSKEGCTSFGLKSMLSHNIEKGKIVEVRYGRRNKILRLKKLAETDRYLVISCDSEVLRKGWTVSIPAILLGVNVIGLDIKDKDITVKSIYKSSGTVTNIKILSSTWDQ